MAVAAMVGMYFLPSFHLVIALQMSADPKTHKKPTTNPTNYLHQYLADEDILSTHPLRMHNAKMPVPYGYTALPSWGRRG